MSINDGIKKVYCILGCDPLNDGEYQGSSWLIKVYSNKEIAEKFIEENELNINICPLTYNDTRCKLYIKEMVIDD